MLEWWPHFVYTLSEYWFNQIGKHIHDQLSGCSDIAGCIWLGLYWVTSVIAHWSLIDDQFQLLDSSFGFIQALMAMHYSDSDSDSDSDSTYLPSSPDSGDHRHFSIFSLFWSKICPSKVTAAKWNCGRLNLVNWSSPNCCHRSASAQDGNNKAMVEIAWMTNRANLQRIFRQKKFQVLKQFTQIRAYVVGKRLLSLVEN